MRTIRAGVVPGTLISLTAFAVSGCVPQLHAIPGQSQNPVEKDHGIFEYRDGLGVSVVAISQPPVGTGSEFVAFGVQVHNASQTPFSLDVSLVLLGLGVGSDWLEKSPIPPDDLVRAYQSARVSASSVVEITPPELVRWEGYHGGVGTCRTYRYYYGYPCYWPGGYYGYGGYYYDGYRDAYLRQQATAAFLAQLLRSQAIPPDHVVGGFIVFSQALHKSDDFRLLVPIDPVPTPDQARGTSQPATAPHADRPVFEFHFVAR